MKNSRNRTIVVPDPMSGSWTVPLMLLLVVLAVTSVSAHAAGQVTPLNGIAKTINVPLYKSQIVQLDGPVHKISVGNKEVADILVMRSNQVYVLGKGIGTTNILLWDKKNNLTQSLDVEVTPDLNALKAKLHQLLPGEAIRVNMSQGAIVLSGEVSNSVNMDTAMKVAHSFLQAPSEEGASQQGSVINLMNIGGSQQVMLKVTVAEMQRSVIKRLGVDFAALFPSSHLGLGVTTIGGNLAGGTVDMTSSTFSGGSFGNFSGGAPEFAGKALFASYLDSNFGFNLAIEAAKENGSAKVLAEPTLTALTGQEAEFLSGGEFPVPVPDEDGITIEFKEYGVGLKFIPVVLDSGRINLNLNVSVSELASTASTVLGLGGVSEDLFIPALTKRSARSTVELGDGQTIGIAGLINESMRDSVNKLPGLGDVPVLGHLFRSQEFQKGETELVILVTPTLAQPFDAVDIALPGQGFVEPSDFEFYILGRSHSMLSQKQSAEVAAPITEPDETAEQPAEATSYPVGETDPVLQATAGGSESTFGHSIN